MTSARTKLIVGDVLAAAGVVAIGVGVYLALTRGWREPASATRAGAASPYRGVLLRF